jgi:phosphate transport system ATP-binding protein
MVAANETSVKEADAPQKAVAQRRRVEGDHKALDGRTVKAEAINLDFHYKSFHAVKGLNLVFREKTVTALIGPSGCGKTTFLRCFNRMHDLYPGNRYSGEINLYPDKVNLVGPGINPIEVRSRISMVFQKPNPFPKSIYENVAYGLRLRGVKSRSEIDDRVQQALKDGALWEEVSDKLSKSAYELSGGQQQRLCIARALAVDPEIILFDEPTSALDPFATASIEDLVQELKTRVTIIIVTHNMQQAQRVSDFTAFMYLGKLVEYDHTRSIFTNPKEQLTQEYITGRFG